MPEIKLYDKNRNVVFCDESVKQQWIEKYGLFETCPEDERTPAEKERDEEVRKRKRASKRAAYFMKMGLAPEDPETCYKNANRIRGEEE